MIIKTHTNIIRDNSEQIFKILNNTFNREGTHIIQDFGNCKTINHVQTIIDLHKKSGISTGTHMNTIYIICDSVYIKAVMNALINKKQKMISAGPV